MIIPSKHTGHTRDGVRRVFDSGGGGGAPSETTQKVDVPDWARGFAKEGVGAASSLVFNRDAAGNITGFKPYETYTGERTAQFTPLQQQAFTQAGQQGIAGQLGQATGIAGQAAQGALGAGAGFTPYQTGQFGAQAGDYMSPYMQNVVDIQQREAQRAADIAGTQLQGQATQAGAFGGGRQAIVESEAARNLALQKGDIQAQGLQSAYEQAQGQFNKEQQLAEQSRQYGAGLGLQGAQTALQGAGALGALGQQQFGQQMDITGQQAQLGQQQQQQVQGILSQQYQDFLNQQRAPYEQLEFLGSQVRGLGQTTSLYQPPPSASSQLIGAGTALAGLAMKAEGGLVESYAGGGITGLLGDQQLAQRQQMPNISTLAKMAVEKEMMDRARMRQGVRAPQQGPAPQSTVADEIAAGLAAADIPDTMFADGGIVSFQSGGGMYQQAYEQGERKGSIYDPNFGTAAARPIRFPERSAGESQSEAEARRAQEEADYMSGEVRSVNPLRFLSPAYLGQLARGGASAEEYYNRGEYGMGNEGRRTPVGPAPAGIAAAAAAAPRGRAFTAPPRADVPPPRTGDAAAAGAKPRPVGIAQAAAPTDAEGYRREVDRLTGGKEDLVQAQNLRKQATELRLAGLADERAASEKEQEALGPVGAAREKSLAAQEARLAGETKQNFSNTLIEAGLAIMGGQSPNAMANIAAGAASGMKGYQARLDKFETATQRIEEGRMRLEEVRREAAMATGAERRKLNKEETAIKSGVLSAEADAIVAATNENRKNALKFVEMQEEARLKREQMRSTENVANIYSARSGAGGGGATATRENRMNLTARLTSAQRDLGQYKNAFRPEDKARKAALEQEVAGLRAALAAIGPDAGGPVQSPAAPTTRMRFDAQGNLIP